MSLANKLADERRAWLAAERLLELKQAELSAANRKLGRHALALTKQIGATQAEVENVRDENERVKSDLTQAQEKVEIAERRLWHSIQTIQDGFAFFDADSKLIGANTSYVNAFDGLEEVTPGVSYVRILQLLTDEGLVNIGDMTAAQWRQMMSDRWLEPNPEPVVLRWWNDQYIRLIDQRGYGGDVVSLALNITSSVLHEAVMRNARKRAEAANRAKSAFLANMSHEIRTPINGVVGMAELLNDTELSEEQRLYATTIKNSGEALLVIINDVLDYSKIEADKLVLHPEVFDLERCIHEVVMLLQPTARDKGIAMLLDYDLFLPTNFVGDAGRFRQVLTNIVGNAVKFTAEGHVLIRVTGMPHEAGQPSAIHVAVEDTGIGIPEEKITHIFGEFNQVDDERNRMFEGTGLGLAISKRLIELMGGNVWVESEVGAGSCFGFRVPLPLSEKSEFTAPVVPENLRHVMIVDDLFVNREILKKQMAQLGIQATCCGSAAEAMTRMSTDIDLILSDHNMPYQDGLEFVEALRGTGWTEVPFLLLSSNPTYAQNDPARDLVQGILQKPISRNELFARLSQLGIMTHDAEGADKEPKQAQRRGETADAPKPEAESPPPQEDPPRPEPEATEPVQEENPPSDQMRVLVAEDNKTNRLVLSKMVKTVDINLKFAKNGEEAVRLYSECEPHLIFMDISMPVIDGKEATRTIRKAETLTGTHVPIVAVTAHAMASDAEEILAAGIDHYMAKPVRKQVLLDWIENFRPEPGADQEAASAGRTKTGLSGVERSA